MRARTLAVSLLAAGLLLAVHLAASVAVIGPPPVLGQLLAWVHFVDVGQGDAILILTGEDSVLIDGGDVWAGRRILSYLEGLSVTRLDHVIVSHPHQDHIGGLPDILRAVAVGRVYDSGYPHPTHAYRLLVETVDELAIPYRVISAGEVLDLAPGVTLEILAPFDDIAEPDGAGAGNSSIVARLVIGDVSFLFTGDIEQPTENRLVRMGAPLRADVLKVAHHGSRSSSSALFIDQVQPRVAVISVGAYNEYGHPHLEVLSRLESICGEVWRTDRHGTIVVVTDGRAMAVHPERWPGEGTD